MRGGFADDGGAIHRTALIHHPKFHTLSAELVAQRLDAGEALQDIGAAGRAENEHDGVQVCGVLQLMELPGLVDQAKVVRDRRRGRRADFNGPVEAAAHPGRVGVEPGVRAVGERQRQEREPRVCAGQRRGGLELIHCRPIRAESATRLNGLA